MEIQGDELQSLKLDDFEMECFLTTRKGMIEHHVDNFKALPTATLIVGVHNYEGANANVAPKGFLPKGLSPKGCMGNYFPWKKGMSKNRL